MTWRFDKLPDFNIKVKGYKLKPCPFCGSKAGLSKVRYKGWISYSVYCTMSLTTCTFQPHAYKINDKRFKRARTVAAIWNKRAA